MNVLLRVTAEADRGARQTAETDREQEKMRTAGRNSIVQGSAA